MRANGLIIERLVWEADTSYQRLGKMNTISRDPMDHLLEKLPMSLLRATP